MDLNPAPLWVRLGDTLSQFWGQVIHVKYDGKWQSYSRTANESISGASNWHADNGRWPWVERWIDWIVFWEERHCLNSRAKDRLKAVWLLNQPPPKDDVLKADGH